MSFDLLVKPKLISSVTSTIYACFFMAYFEHFSLLILSVSLNHSTLMCTFDVFHVHNVTKS